MFWPRLVVRKWLNIAAKESDYSADTESDCSSSTDGGGSDCEEISPVGKQSRFTEDDNDHVDDGELCTLQRTRTMKKEKKLVQWSGFGVGRGRGEDGEAVAGGGGGGIHGRRETEERGGRCE
ncbi:hypothetical protein LINPERHAP2_LOCUS39514 [Linum perenne]